MDKKLGQHGIASKFGYDKKEYSQNINLSKMLYIGMENNNNYQKPIHNSVKNKLDLHLSGTKFKGIKVEMRQNGNGPTLRLVQELAEICVTI